MRQSGIGADLRVERRFDAADTPAEPFDHRRDHMVVADALMGYLETFAANLVAAGIRLGLVGQTDGQRILAALEPAIAAAATTAEGRGSEDFGAATFAVELASMAHETQYTRLFRS